MRKIAALAVLSGSLLASTATAQVEVVVDDSAGAMDTAGWLGYSNFFEIPFDLGIFVFGSAWGLDRLTAEFDDMASSVTFGPLGIDDPNVFWFMDTIGGAPDPVNPGGPGQDGNKIAETSFYQEVVGDYDGQTVTFSGEILADTLDSDWSVVAFVRDFAPDFQSFNDEEVSVPVGPFSVSLQVDPSAGRVVQYGFRMVGPNVWPSDVASKGAITVATVSPPAVCVGDIADDFGTPGGDGQVSFGDFLALLGLLGPCP